AQCVINSRHAASSTRHPDTPLFRPRDARAFRRGRLARPRPALAPTPPPSPVEWMVSFQLARIMSRIVNCVKLKREAEGLDFPPRSEEHTSELQSRENCVCRLLLQKN